MPDFSINTDEHGGEMSPSEKRLVEENFKRGQLQHIKIYRWTCLDCKTQWHMEIDERIPSHINKHLRMENQITGHVLKMNHEVKKEQKFKSTFRRI